MTESISSFCLGSENGRFSSSSAVRVMREDLNRFFERFIVTRISHALQFSSAEKSSLRESSFMNASWQIFSASALFLT